MILPSVPAPAAPPREDERVACEHAERCGGCPLIAHPYTEQLAMKRARVGAAIARYASLRDVTTSAVSPAQPIVEYRTRAKLMAAPGAKLGLYAKGGGHHVVDIPRCRVLAPALARVAAAVRVRIATAEAEAGTLLPYEAPGRGCLRAVDLREVVDGGKARVLLTLVLQRESAAPLEDLRRAAREIMEAAPDTAGVACNFHEGEAPQVLGAETVPLAGVASAPDRIGASVQLATFGSFVQAHRGQAGRVHTLIADALGLPRDRDETEPMRVLDLYGGSGSIALGLAALGARVQLVESFAPAVAQARAAAASSGVEIEADCADVAAALRGMAQRQERVDAVVINPPRRGTSPEARGWLARLGPQTIAYVSCDPETLARDLDHLRRLGYGATTLRPVDMIPLTGEVETVAVLRQTAVLSPRTVYEDDEVLVVEKGPHEPTIPHGEHHGSLQARARLIPGAEGAVPVQCLDVGTSGLVVFVRRSELRAKWERALSSPATRSIYVAAAKGVTSSKGTIARTFRRGGKAGPTSTRYRRIEVASGHSVLRAVPDPERTQQIRQHLAAIGHPVLGDDRYGHPATNRFFEEKCGLDRPFLHCARVELNHPDSGKRCVLEAPLPGDLRMVLERMGSAGNFPGVQAPAAPQALRAEDGQPLREGGGREVGIVRRES
jgi:23S rRNA (uracil1939-C5)-methyltransferase